MTEEEYAVICKHCDELLLDPSLMQECMPISWLHIIREHPHFLSSYQHLLSNQINTQTKLKNAGIRAFRLVLWFRKVLISLFSYKGLGVAEERKSVDFLFISHLLDYSKLSNQSDFYFGEAARRHHSSLIALIDHGHTSSANRKKISEDRNNPYITLSNVLSVTDELSIFVKLNKVSTKLRKKSRVASGVSKRVLVSASEFALSQSSATNIRIGIQASRLVSKLNPKCLVLTCEGHAWERVVCDMVRAVSPGIKCIGYQHAALFRLQHAFFLEFPDRYRPDCMFTPGPNSTKRLKNSKQLHNMEIIEFGSNKLSEASSLVEDLPQVNSVERCLVIPEGIESECHDMLNYALDCAHRYQNVEFVCRLHPVIQFKSLLRRNKRLRTFPENMILSTASMEDDIASCQIALYRGTTAIINAACSGLRPVYLETDNEMTIDPLFELDNNWKVSVSSVEDLSVSLDGIKDPSIVNDRRLTIDYANGFFSKIQYSELLNCIDEGCNG